MVNYHGKPIEHWKDNAEEDYMTTPISVLKYITVLEEQAKILLNLNLMPLSLTAENGAKGLLSGEFFEEIQIPNEGYCGCNECDFCVDFPDEEQTTKIKVPIQWTTIKTIYGKIVEHYGQNNNQP
jgi:hypothetical protein